MKLFVIFGKARSGKDTASIYLKEKLEKNGYRPCIVRITEPLYLYAKKYFGWNENEDSKPRDFLQEMGIEIIEGKLDKKYFLLNRLKEDIEILCNFFDVFIISDARLEKEYHFFKENFDDLITIKVNRKDYVSSLNNAQKNHITEVQIDEIEGFDYIIENKDIESFESEIDDIIRKVM